MSLVLASDWGSGRSTSMSLPIFICSIEEMGLSGEGGRGLSKGKVFGSSS